MGKSSNGQSLRGHLAIADCGMAQNLVLHIFLPHLGEQSSINSPILGYHPATRALTHGHITRSLSLVNSSGELAQRLNPHHFDRRRCTRRTPLRQTSVRPVRTWRSWGRLVTKLIKKGHNKGNQPVFWDIMRYMYT